MLLRVPNVLTSAELTRVRSIIDEADWGDGRQTAGLQSGAVKHNRQLAENCSASQAARAIVLGALERNALFFTAALPRRIFPPLFNRYDGETNRFGDHVDNAIRTVAATGARVRTDLSATLFLTEPESYAGGELVIDDTFGVQRVKLAAGDMVLYPSSSVHRVEPVTSGSRIAAFFWIESMVRAAEQRRLLFDLDLSILRLRAEQGESAHAVALTSCYHNLLRMWAVT
jgi:PKHD-type hydroxylase